MAQELNAKNVTPADVAAGLTDTWCYSDAFKEIHGFRPRGDYWNNPEAVARFWNTFDEEFQRVEDEEQEHLRALGEQHGRIFRNMSAYYDFYEARQEQEWLEQAAQKREAEEARAEFFRRGSPTPIIDAWEHGDKLAA
jgi:hypothetical protein